MAALRRARVMRRKGRSRIQDARQTRLDRAREAETKAVEERRAVSMQSQWHLERLQQSDSDCVPWDDDFIDDLRGLLDRGLRERAATVAQIVTTALVFWNMPDDTLMRRLQSAPTPRAAAARVDQRFMVFVRSQVVQDHQRWAAGERHAERLRQRASQPPPSSDRERETAREEETARRRRAAKRY